MKTIGIDPGLTGGIAIFDGREFEAVYDMPTMTKITGKGNMVDAAALKTIIHLNTPADIWVEDVTSLPRSGSQAAFSFGRSLGVIEGVSAGMPVNYIRSNKWMKFFSLTSKKKSPGCTISLAKLKYPATRDYLTRAKDDGRADAILIAAYAVLA